MNNYDNINNNENIVPLFNSGVSSSQPDVLEPNAMQQSISKGYEKQNDIPPSLGAIKNLTEAPTAEAPTGDVLSPMNIMPMNLPPADPLTSYDNTAQNNQILKPQYNIPSEPQYSVPQQPISQSYNIPPTAQYNIPAQPENFQYKTFNVPNTFESNSYLSQNNTEFPQLNTPLGQPLINNEQVQNTEVAPVTNPVEPVSPPPMPELQQSSELKSTLEPEIPSSSQENISNDNNIKNDYEVVNTPLETEQTYEVVDNTILSEKPKEETSIVEDVLENKNAETFDDDQNISEEIEEPNSEDVLDMMEEEDLTEESELKQEETLVETPKEVSSQPEQVVETTLDSKMSASEIYNKVKTLVESLKASNSNVKTEEYDFTDIYKLVVKIEK